MKGHKLPPAKQRLALLQQLHVLWTAGIPVLSALDTLQQASFNKALRTRLRQVKQRLENGQSLSQACRLSGLFDAMSCQLIALGEASGSLERVLDRLSAQTAASLRLRHQLIQALLYPTIVLLTSSAIITLLLLYVVPSFQGLFASLDARLPYLTHCLLTGTQWLQTHLLYCLGTIASCLGILHWLLRHGHLSIPILGRLRHQHAITESLCWLATCLSAGMPLLNALDWVARASPPRYRQALFHTRTAINAGQGLATSLAQTGVFPQTALQMIQIGESAGCLADMLQRASNLHETALRQDIERFLAWLEPITILGMGGVIGIIVIALYWPIFKLGDLL